MARKQIVALLQEKVESGCRQYGCYTKDGRRINGISVSDCGHGAFIAHQWASKEYTVSCADWIHKIKLDPSQANFNL